MDYIRNTRYFNYKTPIIEISMMVLGTILTITGATASEWGLFTVSFLVAVFGFLILNYRKSNTPLDKEIDQVSTKEIRKIIKTSLDSINSSYHVDKTFEPVTIRAYTRNSFDGNIVLSKQGKDGLMRHSNFKANMFIFTDHQLVYKNIHFSLIRDSLKEATEEYYYDDIVTVKVNTNSSTNTLNGVKYAYQEIQLITKGGNNIRFTFQKSPKVDKVIDQMKHMIRQRKVSEERRTINISE